MSERADNTDLEDEMTRTTELQIDERDDERLDDGSPEGEWEELAEEELPPRPRNRLLAPLPLALIAVLIAASGFLGGVLVQKGSEGGSASGLPGGLPSFLNKGGREGSGSEGSGGFPGGGSGAAVSGMVSSVGGRTIYVKDSEGSTVAVRVQDGSKVSRDSNVSVKKIHPGDSVVVQGAKHGSTVKASSISATESGVEASLPGGFPTSGGSESGGKGGSSAELFGE